LSFTSFKEAESWKNLLSLKGIFNTRWSEKLENFRKKYFTETHRQGISLEKIKVFNKV
jgi:hypothetical protein